MATIEERKIKFEAKLRAKLEALEALQARRAEVAKLDSQMAALRIERRGLLDKLYALRVARGKLVSKRQRATAVESTLSLFRGEHNPGDP